MQYTHPTDTPAVPYIDKDGTFYFQQSAALYGKTDPRYWDFFTGTDFDTATRSTAISNAVNPANSNDRNNDTTWRCNNSPTGLQATFAPSGSGYAQKNYCDLSGLWVDPDTGDWYGLVHNEFTPQPFGDGLHFDAIDYAVSTDQGKTWTIKDHVITSPYSTARGDTAAFPNQTYDYGDGDQRLLVDTASGYFYVFYGSRVVDKNGSWKAFHAHVARAPIASKMAPGSWQKWYDGSWSEAGTGGRESNMVPVGASNTTGYTPVAASTTRRTPAPPTSRSRPGRCPRPRRCSSWTSPTTPTWVCTSPSRRPSTRAATRRSSTTPPTTSPPRSGSRSATPAATTPPPGTAGSSTARTAPAPRSSARPSARTARSAARAARRGST
ncbi:hypothetical protein ACFQ0T_09375 [Kitasatospora gansuensis]